MGTKFLKMSHIWLSGLALVLGLNSACSSGGSTASDNATAPVISACGGNNGDSGLLANGSFESGMVSWTSVDPDFVAENPKQDIDGNNVLYANLQSVAANPWDVNIQQVVELTQGLTYKLSFNAMSNVERKIGAGIGMNEEPYTNRQQDVSLTTACQKFELELTAANFGGANSRVFFEMGAEVGEVIIDDVSLVETTPTPGSKVSLPVDFEDSSLTYTWTDFDGGVATVEDNPDSTNNSSSKVAKLVKGAGQTWAGSYLTLDTAIDFSQGETFSMNFWAASAKPVLLKFEGSSANAEVTANHSGSGSWETLTYDFSGQTAGLGDVVKVVIIVDNGVAGDGTTTWTFYADDIAQN
jgi:hypothetical protein